MRAPLLIAVGLTACGGSSAGTAQLLSTVPRDGSSVDSALLDSGSATLETTAPCGDLAPGGEGQVLVDGAGATDTVARCEERLHAVVMPRGAIFEVTLVSWQASGPAELELRDWTGQVLQTDESLEPGDTVSIDALWAGEHPLVIRATDDEAADYTLAVQCRSGCDAPTTRYPIVFLHGMAGTESFFSVLDYWYQVEPTLRAAGYNVHVASVDPFQTTEVRALDWMAHLEVLVSTGQARRVNVVGHSQGGMDARYMASLLDTERRIQSVTTIATPHRGTATADLVHGLVDGSLVTQVIADQVFDALAGLYGLNGNDQDIVAQTIQLTSASAAQFNVDVPDRSDVAYFSWAGDSCDLLDLVCQVQNGGEIVDPLFSATHVLTNLVEGDNDGLVSVRSAQWGTFLGTLSADHLDEVGLFPGTTAPGFDHLAFYLDEAARLADAGL